MEKPFKLYIADVPVKNGEILKIRMENYGGKLVNQMLCVATHDKKSDELIFKHVETGQEYTLDKICKIQADIHFVRFERAYNLLTQA